MPAILKLVWKKAKGLWYWLTGTPIPKPLPPPFYKEPPFDVRDAEHWTRLPMLPETEASIQVEELYGETIPRPFQGEHGKELFRLYFEKWGVSRFWDILYTKLWDPVAWDTSSKEELQELQHLMRRLLKVPGGKISSNLAERWKTRAIPKVVPLESAYWSEQLYRERGRTRGPNEPERPCWYLDDIPLLAYFALSVRDEALFRHLLLQTAFWKSLKEKGAYDWESFSLVRLGDFVMRAYVLQFLDAEQEIFPASPLLRTTYALAAWSPPDLKIYSPSKFYQEWRERFGAFLRLSRWGWERYGKQSATFYQLAHLVWGKSYPPTEHAVDLWGRKACLGIEYAAVHWLREAAFPLYFYPLNLWEYAAIPRTGNSGRPRGPGVLLSLMVHKMHIPRKEEGELWAPQPLEYLVYRAPISPVSQLLLTEPLLYQSLSFAKEMWVFLWSLYSRTVIGGFGLCAWSYPSRGIKGGRLESRCFPWQTKDAQTGLQLPHWRYEKKGFHQRLAGLRSLALEQAQAGDTSALKDFWWGLGILAHWIRPWFEGDCFWEPSLKLTVDGCAVPLLAWEKTQFQAGFCPMAPESKDTLRAQFQAELKNWVQWEALEAWYQKDKRPFPFAVKGYAETQLLRDYREPGTLAHLPKWLQPQVEQWTKYKWKKHPPLDAYCGRGKPTWRTRWSPYKDFTAYHLYASRELQVALEAFQKVHGCAWENLWPLSVVDSENPQEILKAMNRWCQKELLKCHPDRQACPEEAALKLSYRLTGAQNLLKEFSHEEPYLLRQIQQRSPRGLPMVFKKDTRWKLPSLTEVEALWVFWLRYGEPQWALACWERHLYPRLLQLWQAPNSFALYQQEARLLDSCRTERFFAAEEAPTLGFWAKEVVLGATRFLTGVQEQHAVWAACAQSMEASPLGSHYSTEWPSQKEAVKGVLVRHELQWWESVQTEWQQWGQVWKVVVKALRKAELQGWELWSPHEPQGCLEALSQLSALHHGAPSKCVWTKAWVQGFKGLSKLLPLKQRLELQGWQKVQRAAFCQEHAEAEQYRQGLRQTAQRWFGKGSKHEGEGFVPKPSSVWNWMKEKICSSAPSWTLQWERCWLEKSPERWPELFQPQDFETTWPLEQLQENPQFSLALEVQAAFTEERLWTQLFLLLQKGAVLSQLSWQSEVPWCPPDSEEGQALWSALKARHHRLQKTVPCSFQVQPGDSLGSSDAWQTALASLEAEGASVGPPSCSVTWVETPATKMLQIVGDFQSLAFLQAWSLLPLLPVLRPAALTLTPLEGTGWPSVQSPEAKVFFKALSLYGDTVSLSGQKGHLLLEGPPLSNSLIQNLRTHLLKKRPVAWDTFSFHGTRWSLTQFLAAFPEALTEVSAKERQVCLYQAPPTQATSLNPDASYPEPTLEMFQTRQEEQAPSSPAPPAEAPLFSDGFSFEEYCSFSPWEQWSSDQLEAYLTQINVPLWSRDLVVIPRSPGSGVPEQFLIQEIAREVYGWQYYSFLRPIPDTIESRLDTWEALEKAIRPKVYELYVKAELEASEPEAFEALKLEQNRAWWDTLQTALNQQGWIEKRLFGLFASNHMNFSELEGFSLEEVDRQCEQVQEAFEGAFEEEKSLSLEKNPLKEATLWEKAATVLRHARHFLFLKSYLEQETYREAWESQGRPREAWQGQGADGEPMMIAPLHKYLTELEFLEQPSHYPRLLRVTYLHQKLFGSSPLDLFLERSDYLPGLYKYAFEADVKHLHRPARVSRGEHWVSPEAEDTWPRSGVRIKKP